MIQRTEDEDSKAFCICDPEFSYNPKLFNLNNYPKGFTPNNIVRYSPKDTKIKIANCKQYCTNFKEPYFYLITLRALSY